MNVENIIQKAAVLVEAFPYIRSFRDRVIVVKYGGSTLAEEGGSQTVLADLVFMETVGMKPVVVHGGGREISRRMKESGVEARFVEGLRVTDAATMKIVEDTLFGVVNRGIVGGILRLGGNAKGLSAKDAGIMGVKRHTMTVVEEDGVRRPVDIGFVGDVDWIDPDPILRICGEEAIPVIAPIGLGEDGEGYNVNADTAAGEIANALKAEKLVFLTNVTGIMRDPADERSLLSSLHVNDVDALISGGGIQGGMIPKVRACVRSVKGGVRKTHIIDGRIPHALLLEIFTQEGVGTEIVQ
ncbi:MAG: acetylglutamate kinase [Candidatus Handelsmanbacteria bacterium RIFCSPLOWO2_12_FULL_64_10]|uniref:Acetylglutamate kinase n=1 Tax=Handelsmanbacteria sp. (strain RIFCSPLOWO2_12_FULL_64_10) TaxID=1817868 RepID=A0A1F6D6M4_HANXR|nr:MAG: acetylglutamate kinase [Candidatus Handelsmanbacteria bacterium RIFCSPLOWO2_12_FULL_64_10]